MTLFNLVLIAVGLSMDAFAVSICKGLAMKKISFQKALIVGLWFGVFQGGMPAIGYLLGINFEKYITAIDHWIAFILLAIIGGNMIKEALSKEEEKASDSLAVKEMFLLAIATSIDALAVGITFAFLQEDPIENAGLLTQNITIVPSVLIIGTITMVLSMVGVKIGNVFGLKYKSKAEITGGIILILIGLKILLEHLGILFF